VAVQMYILADEIILLSTLQEDLFIPMIILLLMFMFDMALLQTESMLVLHQIHYLHLNSLPMVV